MEKSHIELKVPSDVYYLESVRAFIGKLCETLKFSKKRIADVQLALDEMCSNAVYHGSTCVSSGIQLQISVDTRTLEIVVRDKGGSNTQDWITPERLAEIQEQRSPAGESGHGLYLIKCLTDVHKLEANAVGGTDVTAIFYRDVKIGEN
ncbi:ATP-binding protein [Candidatus Poribacteria bacterium]|nr:ATP-binding protein [Candidatus Poribacteria bacterium]